MTPFSRQYVHRAVHKHWRDLPRPSDLVATPFARRRILIIAPNTTLIGSCYTVVYRDGQSAADTRVSPANVPRPFSTFRILPALSCGSSRKKNWTRYAPTLLRPSSQIITHQSSQLTYRRPFYAEKYLAHRINNSGKFSARLKIHHGDNLFYPKLHTWGAESKSAAGTNAMPCFLSERFYILRSINRSINQSV